LFFFFFFKQKTAYEISRDWSSDVCSSDLVEHQLVGAGVAVAQRQLDDVAHVDVVAEAHALDHAALAHVQAGNDAAAQHASASCRSEERRVGKGCRARGAPHTEKKKESSSN